MYKHTYTYVIHKCFLSKNRNILVKAYVKYVRPLEYAVCIDKQHHTNSTLPARRCC